ncbi:MAG: AbrB/MazE/SpoVT family DNA-binding domain-containing protein [Candidatus Aenigmarchaeota archaeon]|nr:AbrB/MazE/SpoVT family DNA-binding domain-containing protein [Candidatus Aenigmarchaeota archaeon]
MGKETELEERGRIVIPKDLREALHLKPGQKLLIEQRGRELVLKPAADKDRFLRELQGCVKKSVIKPLDVKKIWEKV